MYSRRLCAALALAALVTPATAQLPKADGTPDTVTHKADVIYARKNGTALTLDVFAPKAKANGRGVVLCVSGGYHSGKDLLDTAYHPVFVRSLCDRGYTLFAVLHRSQPAFTIPDAVEDLADATKFVKAHAREYGIDPDRLGAAGMSAGGHLSLMLGTEASGAHVAAVGCFFPPTDWLNFGKPGASAEAVVKDLAVKNPALKVLSAPFDFRKLDPDTKVYVPVTGDERAAVLKRLSPVSRVGRGSAPTLVIHGDADPLVPIQQAELLADRFKAAGAPFELVVKKGHLHGWPTMDKDAGLIADWFDKHLAVGE